MLLYAQFGFAGNTPRGGKAMKQKSHQILGSYLIETLSRRPSARHTRAFLIGCVEPDRNFFSYFKGSIRSRWFYGHNYQNSDRWIERHIERLRAKDSWNIWNYYCMGKLIHYTSDAFTYVHNNCFTEPISAHREYEDRLQEQFFKWLDESRPSDKELMRKIKVCKFSMISKKCSLFQYHAYFCA